MAKKIFVCIKQVPDTETRFKLNPDGKTFDPSQIKWVVNPYDEYAIEEAIKIKGTQADYQTIAISIGPKKRTVEALRTALAMGIDEAIAIDSEIEFLDHLTIANGLARAIQAEGDAHVILCGKLAIDTNAGLLPQMLAQALSLPHASIVSKADWFADSVTATRELEGGTREDVKLSLPAVISCNKGLNTPRYPSLPGIMKAKKKTIKELSLTDMSSTIESYQVSKLSPPPERAQARLLSGDVDSQVNELVKLLREEAKVL